MVQTFHRRRSEQLGIQIVNLVNISSWVLSQSGESTIEEEEHFLVYVLNPLLEVIPLTRGTWRSKYEEGVRERVPSLGL